MPAPEVTPSCTRFYRVLPILALLLSACSVMVDAGRSQCRTDLDCTTGPHALAAGSCLDGLCGLRTGWSCADNAVPIPQSAAGMEVDIALPVVDLLARDPALPLSANVCHVLDVNCEAPTQTLTMAGSGDLALRLESGFEGYLSIAGDGIVPTLYFLNPPMQMGERLPALTVMSPSSMESLARDMDVVPLLDRGLALLSVQDCDAGMSAGVELAAREADAQTTRFYGVDGLPTVNASVTSVDGSGGFMNAPPGLLTVDAHLPGGEAILASTSVLIRAGHISYGRLLPSAPELASRQQGN